MSERWGSTDAELAELCMETPDGVADATIAVAGRLAAGLRPDALVCASDTLALGAVIAVSTASVGSIPIIGFDDTPVAAALGLSSVEQRLHEVASGALELLLGPEGDTVITATLAPGTAHRLIKPAVVLRRPQNLPLFDPSQSVGTVADAQN